MLRIISELGIAGIILLVGLLYYYRFRKNSPTTVYKIVSRMCLCYIIMRLFRFGHYFDCGLYMFIAMYYQCYRNSKQNNLLIENGKLKNAKKG